ncbi:Uncharacterised protein [Porphyromonas cangingivalis]|uniref:Uncharacterized protein n=1 Tax=Porphyromonas cangingivalis TaxID=36874 RepID=A0A1T4JL44_PORCN|nr:hypothetical protein SAMN02745205_00030 [Porphyromonas cangingivalis]VEJ04317.1 Uncharacterised protein [Porphyromonas cangingivalis]
MYEKINLFQLIFWPILTVCLTVMLVVLIDRCFKYHLRKIELDAQKEIEEMRYNRGQQKESLRK